MKLIPGWRRVLTRALSMHAVYFAGALELASNLLPYVSDFLPWWAPIVVLVAAPILRIKDQGGLDQACEKHADQ